MKNLHMYYQFRCSILGGTKKHTLRTATSLKVGETFNIIVNPYNSNREVLLTASVKRIVRAEVNSEWKRVRMEANLLNDSGIERFIRNEGFEAAEDFWLWVSRQPSQHFILIAWENVRYENYYLRNKSSPLIIPIR